MKLENKSSFLLCRNFDNQILKRKEWRRKINLHFHFARKKWYFNKWLEIDEKVQKESKA